MEWSDVPIKARTIILHPFEAIKVFQMALAAKAWEVGLSN